MTIIIPKPAKNTALQPDMTLTNEPEIETKIGPLLLTLILNLREKPKT